MVRDPTEALRARQLRVTPQRRAILGAFTDRLDEHLSADEVHSRAAAVVPEVGRGTVYATLAELTEVGMLAAVGSPEPVRYETNVTPHDHFRCRLCLRLFDVEIGGPDTTALTRRGFRIEHVAVVVEGVCGDCGAYRRGLEDGAAAVLATPQLEEDLVGTLACRRHESPLGTLLLGASRDGIVRVAFEDHADFDALAERAGRRGGARDAHARIDRATAAVDAYFDGERAAATDVVDWEGAPVDGHAALEATRRIAWGATRSYPEVCGAVSAYDCGRAMGVNPMPVLLPCHRVRLGSTVPEHYVGGQDRRAQLDALESS